jgi:anaerobic magnesium-protoporphyrin IX monomethyl ester cyclase
MAYFNNVVLVKAEVEFFDVSFFEANIPLCYLGAIIKDHVNSVSIPIDMRIDPSPISFKKFEKHLVNMEKQGNKCDLVGISTMTASFPNAIKLAKIAKNHGAYVVAGGYHPSALYEAMFDVPEIDATIRGEGEMTFKELVLKGPSKEVKGLSFRDKDGIATHNPDREKIMNLDSLPFPDRNLRPDNPIFRKHEVIVTSRGCDGACTFCANNVVHGRWRGRSPENTVAELKLLYVQNPDLTIHIWDANFMQDGIRVAKIINLVKENNIHFKYFCEMRVDHIIKHPDLIQGLAEIGMEWIAIGIESPNQEILKKLKKGITPSGVEKAIDILKKNNIKIIGYLMIGDPDETDEQMKDYPTYATKIGVDKIMLAIQTPHPGSQFFKDLEKDGTITSYDWEKYDIGHSVAKLKYMTNRDCELLMDWCWGKFYSPEWGFSQKDTLKESLYLLLSFTWVGYTGFFIHARSRDIVEENLKAYVSAMKGYYDLSKNKYADDYYLDILRGCSFQLTFSFSDGDNISLLALIDQNKKFVIEIFDGKKPDVFLDFTLKANDYIDIIKSLPLQTVSLVYWGGYNFKNIQANAKAFKIFLALLIRSIRISTIHYNYFFKYASVLSKYVPRTLYSFIKEEITLFNGKRGENTNLTNILKNTSNSGKNLLYKLFMFPFTALVPVK